MGLQAAEIAGDLVLASYTYVPLSHPFVERLIGTIRREYLDQVFFWNAADLERKLDEFKTYFNQERTHSGLDGETPRKRSGDEVANVASLDDYRWQKRATRSGTCLCYAKEGGKKNDVTEYLAIRSLPGRAWLVTAGCEALGTMYPGSL